MTLQIHVGRGAAVALGRRAKECAMSRMPPDTACPPPQTALAEAILAYLTEHPQAMDTLEGIAEWWLLRWQVRAVVEGVEAALHRLTEAGLLEEVGDGPSRLYRVKPPQPGALSRQEAGSEPPERTAGGTEAGREEGSG
jgi:hypothetical protein